VKRDSRAALLLALAAGILFGVGLGISGMARPSKVLAFLDVTGAWDPSLAFVMIGAIGVHAVAVFIAKRRARPFGSAAFHWSERTAIDAPLIAGALLFGIGWGLGGICPGPALLGAASGNTAAGVFVVAMIAGMIGRHVSARTAPARTS
jgi:uncharacterized membrane protein YedE/YeeE